MDVVEGGRSPLAADELLGLEPERDRDRHLRGGGVDAADPDALFLSLFSGGFEKIYFTLRYCVAFSQ